MRRREMMRGTLLAAVGLLAAGCTDSDTSSSDAELVWAAVWPKTPAVEIVKRWKDLHPAGPQVKVVELPNTADSQHRLLALELNAELSDFDILELDVIWTTEFAQNGWLVDLAELRAEIERVSLDVAVQTAVWDGRLWAAPNTTDAGLLYYRKDLVGTPPSTWEELRELGLRIGAEERIAPYVADGAQHEGLVVQYLEYFWGAGGDVLDADGRSVLFQTGPALRAAKFMEQSHREGFYAPGFNTMKLEKAREAFQSGQAIFMRSWPYVYSLMNAPDSQIAGDVGIAPLPVFSGFDPVTALGGHNLAVSRFSKNIPAAKEFVHFVSTSPEIQRERFKRRSMAPTLQATYTDLKGDPLIDLLASVLHTAKARPAIPEWTTISEEMQQQIFAAYTADSDPAPEIDALRRYLHATVTER